MAQKAYQIIFPIFMVLLVSAIEITSISRENKNRYKPKNNTIYEVISKDGKTGLSICSSGSNEFTLLKIPENFTNGTYFVRSFSDYKTIEVKKN